MDENSFQTMQEMMEAHEDEKQKWYMKDKEKQKQINALEGKINGYKRTIRHQKEELRNLKPKKKKQYKNQPNHRR